MSESEKASDLIRRRLQMHASDGDRPLVRLATIERLVIACDEIEAGNAIWISESIRGKLTLQSRERAITPSNIDKFRLSKLRSGNHEWKGPTRSFIQSDADLLAYVRAREDERVKITSSRRPSTRSRDLQVAVDQIREPELRLLVIQALENGRVAHQQLDILRRGLSQIPGIDIDAILKKKGQSERHADHGAEEQRNLGVSAGLTARETMLLGNLLDRLSDRDEMSGCGLVLEANRLRLAHSPRTTIIAPAEFELLAQLAKRPTS